MYVCYMLINIHTYIHFKVIPLFDDENVRDTDIVSLEYYLSVSFRKTLNNLE